MKKLGFGCMRFPMQGETVDVEEVEKMVDAFMERGFTYFDTSYVYHNGESESILKKVLVERYPRETFTITTKSPVFIVENQEQFFSIFQQQLDRLGTDYVDYYWLHAVNGEIYQKIQSLNLMDALIQLKKEGRTRHIGLSFHDSPELLDQILTEHPELEYVQLQLNYFDWDSPYVAAGRCYEVCKKHGKQVVVMEPVKGGALVNLPQDLEQKLRNCDPEASMASWAIRFCAGLDHVFMVLSGMSNGKLRSIGLSNYYTAEDFDRLVNATTITPAVLQNETHPYYQGKEMKEHLKQYGTVLESWFPLGGRGNTQRLFDDETISSIAADHHKTSAQIILRWHLQAGNIAIPGSSNEAHIQENYEIFDFSLSDEEMQRMTALDKQERFASY